MRELAIDETSKARGQDYLTIAADGERRAVIFVNEACEAQAVERLAADLAVHGGDHEAIRAVPSAFLTISPRSGGFRVSHRQQIRPMHRGPPPECELRHTKPAGRVDLLYDLSSMMTQAINYK